MIELILKKLAKGVRSFALRGDNNYCPICERRFATFLPYGVRKRPNAQCPGCQSLERQRLLWLYIREKKLFQKPTRLLHVSPETVLFNKFKNDADIDYVPVDKFDPGYRYPKGTQNVDITQMPFPDNSFDAIICIHVLEHIPDDAKAMRALYRVLKPGGWAIILVPLDKNRSTTYEDFSITDPAGREKAFGQPDHVRWYGLDYRQRLEAAGFGVSVDAFAHQFPAEEIFRLGLPDDEDIYFCTKS
jgi:SAM-dependent methyltransferase